MDWDKEQNHLTEQLEILKKLRKRFGEEVIEIASDARLAVHKKWMAQLSKRKSVRPSEIFKHSAFSVTSAEGNFLKYDINAPRQFWICRGLAVQRIVIQIQCLQVLHF